MSEEAYSYLTKKSVLVIPDVLANAGGVIVSYLEWVHNRAGEQHGLPHKEASFAIATQCILEKRGDTI